MGPIIHSIRIAASKTVALYGSFNRIPEKGKVGIVVPVVFSFADEEPCSEKAFKNDKTLRFNFFR